MSKIFVVEQNGRVICGVGMQLDESQARNKVENEMKGPLPWGWHARPATERELHPQEWIEEICED